MSHDGGTRYAIDAATALRIVCDDPAIGTRHLLDTLATLRIRVLGDRVSRMTAVRLARRFDVEGIGGLEYLAVATLQADALICEDASLAEGVVPVVPYDVLR